MTSLIEFCLAIVAAVVVSIVLCAAIFASVYWLQEWNYGRYVSTIRAEGQSDRVIQRYCTVNADGVSVLVNCGTKGKFSYQPGKVSVTYRKKDGE